MTSPMAPTNINARYVTYAKGGFDNRSVNAWMASGTNGGWFSHLELAKVCLAR